MLFPVLILFMFFKISGRKITDQLNEINPFWLSVIILFLFMNITLYNHWYFNKSYTMINASIELGKISKEDDVIMGAAAPCLCLENKRFGFTPRYGIFNQNPVERFHPNYILAFKYRYDTWLESDYWLEPWENIEQYVKGLPVYKRLNLCPEQKVEKPRVIIDIYKLNR
jgi:hypothetical protein